MRLNTINAYISIAKTVIIDTQYIVHHRGGQEIFLRQ